MVTKGYLLITDISGYTSFLTGHELDHAQHIIEALFKSQLEVIQPPLKISNFQGDAILCYAAEADAQSTMLLQQVSTVFSAFVAKVKEMQIDPPCSCNACANIDTLDLKIFIHFGEYIVKPIGDREELMGSDVILAHRMMKNSVIAETGIHSYLLVTDAAFNKLPDTDGFVFVDHAETYDHIGEVKMHVADLNRP
ncbi:MAG TPA: DUF2652 domain-containing protein [Mariprofundaceae bacterium]|jgi:class 3 adenylate cyclase|nr:DUF2652 domain-containing protein [Mariprofundaceae bacterium]